ncbi:DUF418 domain-containing protein [Nonomuraea sp. NPDC050328]|uniref:DUF418 domain-containing protein n=1 Tax=Nonomuraea sp. NPDC050328 TaxID=3364361 RepID=UPI0037B28176
MTRIATLDVLRGFALCGILPANLVPIAQVPPPPDGVALNLLVDQRFFPIFAFLFGVGFTLFLDGSARRHPRPRLLLVRRLAALAVLGALHHLGQPGEALLPYAICGLVVLLPASYLPRAVALAAGLAATAASLAVTQGGIGLIPGMFLLGLAATRYGLPYRLDSLGRPLAVAFALFLAAAVPAVAWQWSEVELTGFSLSGAVAGLLMAGAYVTGLALLMRTRLAPGLEAVFAPLGRLALTNYLGATLLVLGAARLAGLATWGHVLGLAALVLAVQWLFSVLWLRSFPAGPLEWCWRRVTWWGRPLPHRPASEVRG